tara:strand:- start:4392 stop:6305 length:1914 start_codon:yes stop_codon:yes gene_type:complete
MLLLSLKNASKDFGIKSLFKEISLNIKHGEKIGLIGPNGAGKSTLLKVLAGIEILQSGDRYCASKISIQYVGQESLFKADQSILEAVLEGCGNKKELLIQFNQITEELAQNPKDKRLLKALGIVSEQMDIEQAWNLEQKCKEVLMRLGIKDLKKPITDLSGGYLKRISLASALVKNPDVLLLDEPTNHLDASTVEWLQNWLQKFKGGLVLVTHDRYFLDKITHEIIEVDKGSIQKYKGNYQTYLEQKLSIDNTFQKHEKKLKSFLRKELAWLKKGAKARSTKQKARIQRIERMQKITKTSNKKTLELSSLNKYLGSKVIEIENLTLSTNKMLFENFSYSFNREDRVGIIGSNGTGKSSLLNLIAGKIDPSKGKFSLGETVNLGYLDQQNKELIKDNLINKRVIDYIEEEARIIKIKSETISASKLLERFLFTPAQQHSKLSKLSGGEKRRLNICKILMKSPNVLLLDEPTNDLDINTLTILEDYIIEFKGCVIVVSHDRYFLDRTVNRIFAINNGLIERYEGNYTNYMDRKSRDSYLEKSDLNVLSQNSLKNDISNSDKNIDYNVKSIPKRRSFKQNKELEEINKQLPFLEERKLILEERINNSEGNITELSHMLANTIKEINNHEERWLELSDIPT